MDYLLDTNICIYQIKGKHKTITHRLREALPAGVGVSVITVSELEYGIEKSERREQNRLALSEFLTPFEILPYDNAAAHCYGSIRADLEKRGWAIGIMDMLIAAHALSLGAILVTNNESEFRRVPSLRIENWAGQDLGWRQ